MKAPAFDYVRPGSLDDTIAALAAADADGRILAGGQSLVPMLNLRLVYPSVLIDIGALDELRAIRDTGDRVVLGCRVTHAAIEDGAAGDHWHGMLTRVARDIAYRSVRNRGTLGGSLAHADPAADWPVALSALGADIEIAGPRGSRMMACDAFVEDVFTTALEPGEMVTHVHLSKLSAKARWSYIRLMRKTGAFPDAIAAAVHDRDSGFIRVVTGGSATGMRRLSALETALAEAPADAAVQHVQAAVDQLSSDIDQYDKRLHKVALSRAIAEIAS